MSSWESVYAAGQQLNRYPYAEVVSFVKRYSRQKPLTGLHGLDVGCGSGVHANLLAQEGAEVVAFDGSPSAIKHARSLHGHDQITYEVATLDGFSPAPRKFDLVVDRLSSTYATRDVVAEFYQGLRTHLSDGARVLWQGFDPENSGRALGHFDDTTQTWTGFASGVFAPADTIYFFTEEDLDIVFAGYRFVSKRLISDTNLQTGYRHSYWNLELEPVAS